MHLPQLRRVRWAVRATLALGVAASVVANVLHAQQNPISQAIAAWPPLALLLTVELISRVPVHRRDLAFARFAATATIAGIAAWVSYWHMVGVAARYGETGASPYLLPLSVDGLIVVASICLVELGGRISAADAAPGDGTAARRPGAVDNGSDTTGGPSEPAGVAASNGRGARRRAEAGSGRSGRDGERVAHPDEPWVDTADRTEPATEGALSGSGGGGGATRSAGTKAGATAAGGTKASGRATRRPSGATTATPGGTTARSGRPRRPVAETVAMAAAIEADRPQLTEADVAQELGITIARLRAVRRQARELELAA
ncbi:DUF2637 domain-containing protein [Micromonospora sp. NPDC049679]|uniref:DUF2637 domain-containing protein n=1 Tax=Micromonospora sp. NPDC049679 TaxID=3155920 RepID=UPI0033D00DB6